MLLLHTCGYWSEPTDARVGSCAFQYFIVSDFLEIRSSLKRILAGIWWVSALHTGSLDTADSIKLQFSLRNPNSHDKNDGYTWLEGWKTRAWILELKWAVLEIWVRERIHFTVKFVLNLPSQQSLIIWKKKPKRTNLKQYKWKKQRKQRLNSVA